MRDISPEQMRVLRVKRPPHAESLAHRWHKPSRSVDKREVRRHVHHILTPKRLQPLVVIPEGRQCLCGLVGLAGCHVVLRQVPKGVSPTGLGQRAPAVASTRELAVPGGRGAGRWALTLSLSHFVGEGTGWRVPSESGELEALVEEVHPALAPGQEGPHLAQEELDGRLRVRQPLFAQPQLREKHPRQEILGQAAARMREQAEEQGRGLLRGYGSVARIAFQPAQHCLERALRGGAELPANHLAELAECAENPQLGKHDLEEERVVCAVRLDQGFQVLLVELLEELPQELAHELPAFFQPGEGPHLGQGDPLVCSKLRSQGVDGRVAELEAHHQLHVLGQGARQPVQIRKARLELVQGIDDDDRTAFLSALAEQLAELAAQDICVVRDLDLPLDCIRPLSIPLGRPLCRSLQLLQDRSQQGIDRA